MRPSSSGTGNRRPLVVRWWIALHSNDLDVSLDRAYWDVANVPQLDYRSSTERNAAFSQLDLRIDKKWFFENWSLMCSWMFKMSSDKWPTLRMP